jgi:YD repeat-containing protein
VSSGNPQVLQDAGGNKITSTFDDLGRKQSVNDPNMGSKQFVYNGFGEVIQQTVTGEFYSTYYQYK